MDYIIMENGEKILLETQQKVTIQRTVDTRFESGNYNPSLEFLVKIAGAMGKKVKVTLED